MSEFLKSKKVKALILGLATTALTPFATKAGISEELVAKALAGIFTIVTGYLVGQGFADGASGGKTSSQNGA